MRNLTRYKSHKRKGSCRQRLSATSSSLSDPEPAPRWFLYVPVAAVLAAMMTVLSSTAFAWLLENFDQARRALAAHSGCRKAPVHALRKTPEASAAHDAINWSAGRGRLNSSPALRCSAARESCRARQINKVHIVRGEQFVSNVAVSAIPGGLDRSSYHARSGKFIRWTSRSQGRYAASQSSVIQRPIE